MKIVQLNNIKPPKAVVFDFDGTLADVPLDFGAMRREVRALASRFVEHVPPDDAMPALEWLQSVAGDLERTSPGAAKSLLEKGDQAIRDMETRAAAKGDPFPFARTVLAGLRAAGVSVAVITRNCTPAVKAAFPDLHELVSVVLTRDDVPRVKPDPGHIGRALELLGVEPERAIMVGDHFLDIETGTRAGVVACGVLTGRVAREEFAEHGASMVFADCAEMLDILQEMELVKFPESFPRQSAEACSDSGMVQVPGSAH